MKVQGLIPAENECSRRDQQQVSQIRVNGTASGMMSLVRRGGQKVPPP